MANKELLIPKLGIVTFLKSDGWYYCLLSNLNPSSPDDSKGLTGPFKALSDILAIVGSCPTCGD
ncbi:MAG: hypothetical protein COW76_19625 [Shewanella sp. CG18_big_fil_WC_8_21_14_2_50_42_11]|nr:MAG: hypothetical protein COW76_19625 [Shewanella sp. CG18_big_fil_WC_8_21_14_2_50_42_11]